MSVVLRNIIAVIVGAVIGGIVNMGIISISGSIIPPPEGADLSTTEGINAAADLMQPKHFIFPFLAHALGTLVGGLVAAAIGKSSQLVLALIVGFLFLIGGISMTFMVPAPTWFIALDLIVAYIPMAWLGYKIKQSI
ncbi:hypothetical protein [Mesonia aquimarina]|uniref:hypothetical protein n=1 Tax=Mesonia aquimarina TaxID=1504967 RepID=UPI000EF5A589|nr:hypothetical protein [Mesonia aquimarina]